MARGVSLSEAERAREFAKAYVALVEALQQQGVPIEDARSEARITALIHMRIVDSEESTTDENCPLCGR